MFLCEQDKTDYHWQQAQRTVALWAARCHKMHKSRVQRHQQIRAARKQRLLWRRKLALIYYGHTGVGLIILMLFLLLPALAPAAFTNIDRGGAIALITLCGSIIYCYRNMRVSTMHALKELFSR